MNNNMQSSNYCGRIDWRELRNDLQFLRAAIMEIRRCQDKIETLVMNSCNEIKSLRVRVKMLSKEIDSMKEENQRANVVIIDTISDLGHFSADVAQRLKAQAKDDGSSTGARQNQTEAGSETERAPASRAIEEEL